MIPGTYHATLIEGITTVSKSNTPMMAIEFEITHHMDGGQWEPLSPPQRRTLFLAMSAGAWEYSEKKLKALGFNGDFNAPEFSDAATNEGVDLLCNIEQYEGKDRERWELANWGGMERQQAGADVLRKLAAQWRAAGGTVKPAAAKPAPKLGGQAVSPPPAQPIMAPAAPSKFNVLEKDEAAKAPPAPPPVKHVIAAAAMTRDEAWNVVLNEHAQGDMDKATVRWQRGIEGVAKNTGRAEPNFTDADWGAVANDASIPF